MPRLRISSRLSDLAALGIHVAGGSIAFLLLLAPAVAISAVLHYVERRHLAPEWLVQAATAAEVAIFAADVLAVGAFVLSEVVRYVRSLEWR